jgi:hypothetical protein
MLTSSDRRTTEAGLGSDSLLLCAGGEGRGEIGGGRRWREEVEVGEEVEEEEKENEN